MMPQILWAAEESCAITFLSDWIYNFAWWLIKRVEKYHTLTLYTEREAQAIFKNQNIIEI